MQVIKSRDLVTILYRQVHSQTAIEMHIDPVGEEEKSLGLQLVDTLITLLYTAALL